MAMTEASTPQQKQSRIASHWKVLVVIVVVVLIALPLAVFVPVRITVNITFYGEHSIRIIIDDKVMGDYDLPWYYHEAYQARTLKSYSVGVGQHTVTVSHEGMVELREVVAAWPFVGAEVDCTVVDY